LPSKSAGDAGNQLRLTDTFLPDDQAFLDRS
jgi:hypothetical protein